MNQKLESENAKKETEIAKLIQEQQSFIKINNELMQQLEKT